MRDVATYSVLAKALSIINLANRKCLLIETVDAEFNKDGIYIHFNTALNQYACIHVREYECVVEVGIDKYYEDYDYNRYGFHPIEHLFEKKEFLDKGNEEL